MDTGNGRLEHWRHDKLKMLTYNVSNCKMEMRFLEQMETDSGTMEHWEMEVWNTGDMKNEDANKQHIKL